MNFCLLFINMKVTGEPMDLSFDEVKELLDPFFHTYTCQDGRPFYLVAPCHALHQIRALKDITLTPTLILDPREPQTLAIV